MTARRINLMPTCIHESGHACVAVELCLPFTKVCVDPDTGGGQIDSKQISTAQLPRRYDPRIVDLLERDIVCDFAGAMAMRRYAPAATTADPSDISSAEALAR
jgi:hypothetical protein